MEEVKQERMRIQATSADIEKLRLDQLKQLFPEAVSEGQFDIKALGDILHGRVDEGVSRFAFSWAGKAQAISLLRNATSATLIPVTDQSLGFEKTHNAIVEGDNLEVLKLLHKAYFGKVQLIYIDPPYNTGNDFIYSDDYSDSLMPYLQMTGQSDKTGNLLSSNSETSGRFHSNWLSMMYPRLFLARQLLRDDGAIFVSIDDTEVAHLRLLMNELFGEENFIAQIIWEKRSGPPNDRVIGSVHEFILVYAKSADEVSLSLLPRTGKHLERYTNPDNDPRGPWVAGDLSANAKGGRYVAHLDYEIVNPRTGQRHAPPEGACWRFSREKVDKLIADGSVFFGADDSGRPKLKRYLSDVRDGITVPTIWKDLATNTHARAEIREFFGESNVFETPKPVTLLKRIIQVGAENGGLVLDFFAGSGTTAQAVLEMNQSDGKERQFILVQLPEPTSHHKHVDLAKVAEERIRQVCRKLDSSRNGETDVDSDLGFRVFKLAPSNVKAWQEVTNPGPQQYYDQMQLLVDPFVEDWQPQDVVWEIAIKEGFPLTSSVTQAAAAGQLVYRVSDPDTGRVIHVCLDDVVTADLAPALDLTAEDLLVLRDTALDDTTAANLALQCRLKTL